MHLEAACRPAARRRPLALSPEPSGATGRDGSPLAIRANVYSTSVAPFTRSAWRPTRSRHLSAESLPAPLLRPPARRLVCPYSECACRQSQEPSLHHEDRLGRVQILEVGPPTLHGRLLTGFGVGRARLRRAHDMGVDGSVNRGSVCPARPARVTPLRETWVAAGPTRPVHVRHCEGGELRRLLVRAFVLEQCAAHHVLDGVCVAERRATAGPSATGCCATRNSRRRSRARPSPRPV